MQGHIINLAIYNVQQNNTKPSAHFTLNHSQNLYNLYSTTFYCVGFDSKPIR